MSFGVVQEYYKARWSTLHIEGDQATTGVVGTTTNGVMYLAMPLLFALFTRRYAQWRRTAALVGAALACVSFALSSLSTNVYHLIISQGVFTALGATLMFSPTTLTLSEWYNDSNRALALGVTLSCKNITGSTCPFLFQALLNRYTLKTTILTWTAICGGTSAIAILLIPDPPSTSMSTPRERKIPWQFLQHQTFWIFAFAVVLQSAGYGIPQTYLPEYASEAIRLSQTSATLLLTLFNIPGIASSTFFGYLSDNKHFRLSADTVAAMSAVSSALAAFLLWGLTGEGSIATLLIFSITFGFFAGGYSATWGGVLNDMEHEAVQRNEAIDTGMVYGLLNGARGIGYVTGGIVGLPLLKAGARSSLGQFAYGSSYGPLIVFTGVSSLFGGWALLWKSK